MSSALPVSLVARAIARHFRLAIGLWIALCLCGQAWGAAAQAGEGDLTVVGVAGPSRVVLTQQRPSATKPVAVVIENRSSQPKLIPDAASLRSLIALRVETVAGIPASRLVLVPPKKLPITLLPRGKLAVVFRVTLDLGDSPAGTIGLRFEATLAKASPDVVTAPVPGSAPFGGMSPPRATALSGDAGTAPVAALGPDKGATVTAKPLRVPLKKGESESEPITFKVDWPGNSYFVSGWECMPGDGVATPLLQGKQTRTVTVRWGTPGDYLVTAYPTRDLPGGGFEQAHPSELIHVIKVEFKDENGADLDGAKIGITTKSKDRSRTFTAEVFPSTETQNVTLKVTKGGSTLKISDITYLQGRITFKAEGIGTTGSKSPGDCRIEAKIEDKTAATADVTVILPQTLLSSTTVSGPQVQNIAVDRHSVPPSGDVPEGWVDLYTFYLVIVHIKVGDQFKQPLVSAENDDYLGAEVAEVFPVDPLNPGVNRINQQIHPGSFYIDPVGSVYANDPPWRRPKNSRTPVNFVNEPNPVYPPIDGPRPDVVTIIRPAVDGFQLKNLIRRVVTEDTGVISVDDKIQ